jgi:hypothetical protein
MSAQRAQAAQEQTFPDFAFVPILLQKWAMSGRRRFEHL